MTTTPARRLCRPIYVGVDYLKNAFPPIDLGWTYTGRLVNVDLWRAA